jgi:phosphate transport system substrate-binding protein
MRALLALLLLASLAGAQSTSLPTYKPARQVTGNIRSWGSDQMGPLLRLWEKDFQRYQPGVSFSDDLLGTATAQYGLHEWVADLAVSTRQIYPYEYYGLYRRSLLYPVEIAVATGSYNVPRKSFALGVFVNKQNPLTKLTLQQLDGIFGAHRTGGWQRLSWVTAGVARGADKDIRTWGQLGLTGAWADKPIHVYGPPGIYPGGVSFFQTRVMGGADSWNEHLMEFADRKKMMQTLSEDPYGIAYTGISYETPQTKALALGETEAGPFVPLTRTTVQARTYPLSRLAYIYFAPDRPNGEPAEPPVDPKVEEFLTYILSKQGQAQVSREGDYLPLTPEVAAHSLEELWRRHTVANP